MVTVDTRGNGAAPTLEERLALAQAEGLEANLRRQLRFVGGPRVVELQAVGVRKHVEDPFERVKAGHARSAGSALALAVEADRWMAQGVYLIPSRLKPGVETRRTPDVWHELGKRGGTTDHDIDSRTIVPLDFDVARVSNITATEGQMGQSVAVALEAWGYLVPIVGSAALAWLHSGNGRQIHFAVDVGDESSEAEVKPLVASILAGADALFSNAAVKVDLKMVDAKRLVPLAGTMKKKGAPGIAERPHRRTAIVTADEPTRRTLDELRELHARLREDCGEAGRAAMDLALGIKPKPKPNGSANGAAARPAGESPFAVANALDPTKVAEWLDLFESGGLRCPGCGESQGVDIIDHGLKCLHNRCDGKGKHGFRTNVDLVAEVRAVDARGAVNLLAERFGFEPLLERATNGQGATDRGEARPDDAHPYSRWRADQDERDRQAVGDAAHEALVRCLSADEFFAAESTANLVVPALGICPGPPTGAVGQSYVGKTITVLAAGMSVAISKPLWGVWSVQQGPWLHLDYEQGRRHTKARMHRLARGFGLSDDELRGLLDARIIRVAVLPELRLSTAKAVDHFVRAFEGVRLVTCDSLRPMLGAVDENSSQVRSLMGVLSTASDRTGAAVLLIHHAGKTPIEGAPRTRKEMARGSSAIVDEMQSVFVLSKNKGDAVTLVSHEKDRELGGDPVADFGLRIEDVPTDDGDTKGGLRVVHVDREQMKQASASADDGDEAFARAIATARDCIATNPGIAGADAVTERTKLRRATVGAAIKQLLADEVVVAVKGPRNGVRLYLKHMAPAGKLSLVTPCEPEPEP